VLSKTNIGKSLRAALSEIVEAGASAKRNPG
jgi:hypothetical protein